MYRKEFEESLKGKPSMDLDKTPEFLHIKQVTNLLKEVDIFLLHFCCSYWDVVMLVISHLQTTECWTTYS